MPVRIIRTNVIGLALILLAPMSATAQSTGIIAGVVKDSSGAVLPGVTVEAASPSLIEKVRSATTDGGGQYKIVDLTPGTYSVTFTLPGFSAVKREGVQLSANFTAAVNADLKVGALEETIVVSGQTPTVDVQNTRQATSVPRDIVDVLPVAKSAQNFATFVPGVIATSQDVGGTVADRIPSLRIHGSRSIEMPLIYDGMRVNNMNATPGGGHLMWGQNAGAVQEYQVEVGALSAEADVSGVRENAIPKIGGNMFKSNLFFDITGRSLESTSNVPDITGATWNKVIWDFNPAVGGPIKQDKIWWWGTFRYWGNNEHLPGAYYNVNPLGSLVYTADPNQPAYNKVWGMSEDARITWQLNSKNKFSFMADNIRRCWCKWTLTATTDPNAAAWMRDAPNLVSQATWNSTVTNKLLIDAGYTVHPESWAYWPQPYLPVGIYPVTDQSTGINFNARSTGYAQHRSLQLNGKFIVTYVTGSHAFKVGFQEMHGWRRIDTWTQGPPVSLTVLSGVPRSLTEYTYPYSTLANVPAYDGIFGQDQWTLRRLTVNAGLRFDWITSNIPAQSYPATPLVPARSFPAAENAPNWKDINPRLGLAYDLFGNNKTALKFTVGRFIQAVTTAYADNVSGILATANSASRSWNDANTNGLPDCDLMNTAANGECGALNNKLFGTTTPSTTYDPDFLTGWGKRPRDWEVQAGIQHELAPNVTLTATWVRHWWGNFLVTDNRAVSPSDYSTYCITAPVDSRLPGGGGNQICGFADINPDKFGQVDNFITFAKNFGNQTDVYKGMDLSINLRLPHGALLQGGMSTGHEVFDNCDVVAKVDNLTGGPVDIQTSGLGTPLLTNINGLPSPSKLYCHIDPPLQTQVKLEGAYPLPWASHVSVAFQSIPGRQITASYAVTNGLIAPSLGRNLSGNASTATVQLIAPGTLFGDRLNQLDIRLSKEIQYGHARLQPQVNVYNALNSGAILGYNNTFGPKWQDPTAREVGRMLKFGLQLDF
jgi:hypothetical protein